MHFAGGIAVVSPGILAMAWFILEPELLEAPSHTSHRGPIDAYPHAPIMGFAGKVMPGHAGLFCWDHPLAAPFQLFPITQRWI